MTKATYTRIATGIEMIDNWEEWGGFYYTIYEYLEEIYSYKLPFDWFDILWKAGFRPEREEGKEFYISSPMQILEYIPHLRTNYLPELEDGEECEYEYPITMEIQSKYFRKADRMINKILELAEKKWNEPKLQLLYLERKCEHLGKQIIEKDYEIKKLTVSLGSMPDRIERWRESYAKLERSKSTFGSLLYYLIRPQKPYFQDGPVLINASKQVFIISNYQLKDRPANLSGTVVRLKAIGIEVYDVIEYNQPDKSLTHIPYYQMEMYHRIRGWLQNTTQLYIADHPEIDANKIREEYIKWNNDYHS